MTIYSIFGLTWAIGTLIAFIIILSVKLVNDHPNKKGNKWLLTLYCLAVAALWPMMLPSIIFRPASFFRALRVQLKRNRRPEEIVDYYHVPDGEPDPKTLAEEYPDWTDGTEEYED